MVNVCRKHKLCGDDEGHEHPHMTCKEAHEFHVEGLIQRDKKIGQFLELFQEIYRHLSCDLFGQKMYGDLKKRIGKIINEDRP